MLFSLLLGEHQICYEQIWYIVFEYPDWWLIGSSQDISCYDPVVG